MLRPLLRAKNRKAWWRRVPNSRPALWLGPASGFLLALILVGSGCSTQEPSVAAEAATDSIQAAPAPTAPTERRLESGDQTVSQRLRDASLAAEIQLALMDERALRAFRFDPVVVDGQVLLQGNVETLDQRERAASVAASVPGVQDVINEVTSTESPVAATP